MNILKEVPRSIEEKSTCPHYLGPIPMRSEDGEQCNQARYNHCREIKVTAWSVQNTKGINYQTRVYGIGESLDKAK